MARLSKQRRQELAAEFAPAGRRVSPAAALPRRPQPRVRRAPWWQGAWGLAAMALAVAGMVAGFVLLSRAGSSAPTGGLTGDQLAPASVLAALSNPTLQVVDAVGSGGVANPLKPLSRATPLAGSQGKPEVLYIGADFCPFCAAERWSLILTLSRFGSFSNLHLTTSSSTDVFPDTSTFSFYGSTYSSAYLDFAGVEEANRDQQPLQALTREQQTLIANYDGPPYAPTAQGIPFLDLGNRYVAISSGYSPEVLAGMSWQQIADSLSSASSPQAMAIIGNANYLTAGICRLTSDQPKSVCAAGPIPSLEARLGPS